MTQIIAKISQRALWQARNGSFLLLAGAFLLLGTVAVKAQAPETEAHHAKAGCTLNGGTYTCSRFAFHRALKHANILRVETRPMDRNGRMQLEELVGTLGKTLQTGDQPADLTFVLMAVESDGVRIGPAASDLATLSVYAAGPEGGHGDLVWSETFRGQPDMRWPAVVHALLAQFQGEFQKH